ncbi:MAG TPA: SpoIIE family protein phosphatase [Tepidiformaceae bacterium]
MTEVSRAIRSRADTESARRDARRLAREAGLGPTATEEFTLAVIELSSNIVRHAPGGGTLILRANGADDAWAEVVATDTGPGIRDIARAVGGGHSTAGGLGRGLAGARRLLDHFEITSSPEGTRVAGKKWKQKRTFVYGLASRPHPGFSENGDGGLVLATTNGPLLAVVDGVGHGATAATAAAIALEAIGELRNRPLADILRRCHQALYGSRGAVVSLVRFEDDFKKLTFAGIGNVEGRIISPHRVEGVVPLRGILGAATPTIRTFEHDLPERWLLMLYTDGVSRRARPPEELLEGVFGPRDLQRTADELLARWARATDDATILLGGLAPAGQHR